MDVIAKLKKTKVARATALGILKLLGVLNQFIPKKDRILFYESMSDVPVDNSEALCTWLLRNGFDKHYEFVYCVPSLGPFSEPMSCRRVGALGGVIAFLRSKYVFYSFGGFRIRPAANQSVVCLWHGAQLKTIGKLTSDEYMAKEDLDDFTYVIATAEIFAPIMKRAMGCPDSKVRVLGYPRNDYLFSEVGSLDSIWGDASHCSKAILWMPTFRNSVSGRWGSGFQETETGLPVLTKYENLRELDALLVEQRTLLIVKAHPLSQVNFAGLKHIRKISNEHIFAAGMRLYEFVNKFDALITDYSSIYFDWLLLDRPMAFTLDDFDEYAEKHGFALSDPLSFMPGEHVFTPSEFERFCADVAQGRDRFRADRQRVRKMTCAFSDDQNCKRLVEELGM